MESRNSSKFLCFEDNRENSACLCGWTYIDVPQWERNRHWRTWLQHHYSLHKQESYAANDFRPFHTSQHKYSPDPWFSCSWWSACSETQAWICSQPQSLDRKTPTNNSINRWQVVFTDWHKVHKIPTDKTTKRAGSFVSKFQVNGAFKRWRFPCSSHEGMKSPHRFAISTTKVCNLNRWRVHHEMAATHTVEKLLQSDSQTVLNRNHGTAASSRGATKAPLLSSGFYK